MDADARRQAKTTGLILATVLTAGLLIAWAIPGAWGVIACLGALGALGCMVLPFVLLERHRRELRDNPDLWMQVGRERGGDSWH